MVIIIDDDMDAFENAEDKALSVSGIEILPVSGINALAVSGIKVSGIKV